jgi:hypothetical protein
MDTNVTTTTTINADDLFIAAIGEIPRSAEWASARLGELTDGGGILKRLMAAVRSATRRGISASEWSFTPDGPAERQENGAVWESSVTGTFALESRGGVWSNRSWRFEAFLEVSVDDCGVECMGPQGEPGAVMVTSRENPGDATTFTGLCVSNFAAEIMRRCVMHQWADELTMKVVHKPEWRSRAVEGIAQLAYACPGDGAGTALAQYLSGNGSASPADAPAVLEALMYELMMATPESLDLTLDVFEVALTEWGCLKSGDLGDVLNVRVGARGVPSGSWIPRDEFGFAGVLSAACGAVAALR